MRFGSLLSMRIGFRLSVGFGLLLILTLIVGGFAIRSVNSVAALTANLYEHPFAVTNNLLEARVAIRTMQRAVRDAALAQNATERNQLAAETDAQFTVAAQSLKVARSRFLGDVTKFDVADRALSDYRQVANSILELFRQDKMQDALAALRGPGARAVEQMNAAMDPLMAFANDKAGAFMQNAEATRDQTVRTNLLLLVGAILLGGIASFVATRSITYPLAALRASMAVLADGKHDITTPGLDRHDEIGEMAQAVEVFRRNGVEMEGLRAEQETQKKRAAEERKQALSGLADTFESGIKGVVNSVAAQSTQMQSAAQAMTHTAGTATQQATAVAASVEQASANVQTVATAAEELSASVLEIGRQVDQSSKIAGQAVAEADRTNVTVRNGDILPTNI